MKINEDISDKRIIVVDAIVMKKKMIKKKLKEKLHTQEKTSITEYMIRHHLLEYVTNE